uniref:Uncharacterized protein n=1 Tax=Romanomermis culicivorax TaxID=13658 RepID=A0A915ITZ3_ROMCU
MLVAEVYTKDNTSMVHSEVINKASSKAAGNNIWGKRFEEKRFISTKQILKRHVFGVVSSLNAFKTS